MMTYVAQRRYLLNNQVPTVIFSSTTILATLHYSEFTNKYSPQYGSWSFLTNNLFSTFFSPLPRLSPNHTANSICYPATIPTSNSSLFKTFTLLFSLYPKLATEHYLQEFINVLNSLVDNRSYFILQLTSLIQLPLHRFHSLLSVIQPTLLINWPPCLPTVSSLLSTISPIKSASSVL